MIMAGIVLRLNLRFANGIWANWLRLSKMCFLWKDPWLLWRRCRLNLAYWEINQIIVKAKECMPLNTCSPIGESLLTSLFSFLLISIRLT